MYASVFTVSKSVLLHTRWHTEVFISTFLSVCGLTVEPILPLFTGYFYIKASWREKKNNYLLDYLFGNEVVFEMLNTLNYVTYV